jgi:peptidoglycan LD-endopeptidase LytH
MRLIPSVFLLFLLSGCAEQLAELRKSYQHGSAREAYVAALAETGISDSAIATNWTLQGEAVLQTALTPDLPYMEEGVLNPSQIMAVGYRLSLTRGQRLIASATISGTSDLFLDLFETIDNASQGFKRVESADTTFTLQYDVNKTSEYVLRVQPEILATGTFTLSIKTEASLIFPVMGRSTSNILSRFGVERDGGRRSHHGVDIFANRGTPVVAVRKGQISSTKIGGLGGKTVWLKDDRGNNFYYAHLDSQLVREGQRVVPGDTLGLVGNTGNSRTTAPHLHFGVYARGPHDPWPFLFTPSKRQLIPSVDSSHFGNVVLVEGLLKTRPNNRAQIVASTALPATGMVIGASGAYYHVRLYDKSEGYVHKSFVGPATP